MHNLTPTDMDPSVERRRDEPRGRRGRGSGGDGWMERERKSILFVSMSSFYPSFFLLVKFKTMGRRYVAAFVCLKLLLFFKSLSFSHPSHTFLRTAGLQPYTEHSFVLVACTATACGASGPSLGRTLQASPAGRTRKTLEHLPGTFSFDVLAGEVASGSSSTERTNPHITVIVIQC